MLVDTRSVGAVLKLQWKDARRIRNMHLNACCLPVALPTYVAEATATHMCLRHDQI